jgi:hypothetical protein
MKKDWEKLRKQAEDQGWRVIATNKRHYRWLAPDGKTTVVSGSTCSDHRGIKNQLALMRRAGFRD